MANRTELSGELLARDTLRYTPAGIPVVEFTLRHASRQEEGGGDRQVECEMACVALGSVAGLVAAARLGDRVIVNGFLAARSLKRRTVVLHVVEIEFQEGNENGFQT